MRKPLTQNMFRLEKLVFKKEHHISSAIDTALVTADGHQILFYVGSTLAGKHLGLLM